MTRRNDRTRRARRGAVSVEAVASATLFFTLLLGIIEGGFMMSDFLGTSSATRAATRIGTAHGNDADADYVVLHQLAKEMSAVPSRNIDQIIIFKATGPGASVPAACKTAAVHVGVSNAGTNTYCNVYNKYDLTAASTNFGCASSTYYDCGWDPKTRVVAVGAGVSPDYIGVYIKITHPAITGLFASSYTFSSTAVYPLEPRTL